MEKRRRVACVRLSCIPQYVFGQLANLGMKDGWVVGFLEERDGCKWTRDFDQDG